MYDSKTNILTCKKCNHKIDCNEYPEPSFCPNCGFPTNNYCSNCYPNGAEDEMEYLNNDDKFCYICGSKTLYYDVLMNKEN